MTCTKREEVIMSLPTPDWLAKRGGELRPGTVGHSWFVVFDGAPQYKLVAAPAAGKHGCHITQTINGRVIECTATAPAAEEAVRLGLDTLRQALGW
jgi:hypothetical protein